MVILFKQLKRTLRIYTPFVRSELQRFLSYRVNMFIFFFGGLLRIAVAYYLWKAVFANSPASVMEGFSFDQMVTYLVMSFITEHLVFNDVNDIVADEVKDGSIAMHLIRPISYQLRIFFMLLGRVIIGIVTTGVPVYLAFFGARFFVWGRALPAAAQFWLYLASGALSVLMVFFLDVGFGFLAFYTINTWGLGQLKHTIIFFLSGLLIPLAFFPPWAQHLFRFFPFASMVYTPIMIFRGDTGAPHCFGP